MSLASDKEISEIYYLKHKNDKLIHRHFAWENSLLKNSTSPYIWRNPIMNQFLTKIEVMTVLMVEQMVVARNFYNYTVDKYYNDYWG